MPAGYSPQDEWSKQRSGGVCPFRVDENGKLVEQWDMLQVIPGESAIGNAMFQRAAAQSGSRTEGLQPRFVASPCWTRSSLMPIHPP